MWTNQPTDGQGERKSHSTQLKRKGEVHRPLLADRSTDRQNYHQTGKASATFTDMYIKELSDLTANIKGEHIDFITAMNSK